MPKRKEVIVRVEMTPAQNELMKKLIVDNVSVLASNDQKQQQKGISQVLIYLRQAANHPQLLGSAYCTDNFSRTNLLKKIAIKPCETSKELLE